MSAAAPEPEGPGALAAVAAHGLRTGAQRAVGPMDQAGWAVFFAAATRERLAGLLLAAALDGALDLLPEQQQQVEDLHVSAMASAVRLERELVLVAGHLGGAGIDLRVLKGPAVARLDYADVALRPFADIDLLVRSEQVDLATEVLASAGYERRFPQPRPGFDRRFSKGFSLRTPDGHEIDLHRTLVMGPFGLSLRLDQLWARTERIEVGGLPLLALGAEERLLHAAFHVVLGDVPPRLAPQRDLAEMLTFGSHDPDRVVALAEGWQAGPVLASAVLLTWHTLGLDQDHALLRWARARTPSAGDERRLAVYGRPGTNYSGKSFEAIRALPSWADRVAFSRALLMPTGDYVRQRHTGRLPRLRHGLDQVRESARARWSR